MRKRVVAEFTSREPMWVQGGRGPSGDVSGTRGFRGGVSTGDNVQGYRVPGRSFLLRPLAH